MASTLTTHTNPDQSVRIRKADNPVESYVVPHAGRFQVQLVNTATGKQSLIVSASTAAGAVKQARLALLYSTI